MVLEDVNLHLPMPECCAVSRTLVISVRQSLHFCLLLVLPFLLLHFITHHLCFEAFAAIREWQNLLFYLVLAPHLQHFYTNCILLLSPDAYKWTEYKMCVHGLPAIDSWGWRSNSLHGHWPIFSELHRPTYFHSLFLYLCLLFRNLLALMWIL